MPCLPKPDDEAPRPTVAAAARPRRALRIEFSDAQRAAIFVRDRATCSYSGRNLWLLDAGATPLWDVDWVDHHQPCHRGGATTIDNGVCAARFFNLKKRHFRDAYPLLFHAGQPTAFYRRYFGRVSGAMAARWRRFAALQPADWLFNRCLYNAFLGFDYRCQPDPTRFCRDDDYWFRAAWKRLRQYQQQATTPLAFRLAGAAQSPDQVQLLALVGCKTAIQCRRQLERLSHFYLANDAALRTLLPQPFPDSLTALATAWPLPRATTTPRGVIDTVWQSPLISPQLHALRVQMYGHD